MADNLKGIHSLARSAAFVVLMACTSVVMACGEILRGEIVILERDMGETRLGETRNFHVVGAGWFRALAVEKRGGTDDNTTVTLELDGQPMITASFASLKNPWMQIGTTLMGATVRTQGETSTMAIWYSAELKFTGVAAVRIDVREEGVTGVKMRTVMNKPAPHEHIAGQQLGAIAALPAFQ